MGLLVKGVWHDDWYDTKEHKGEFIRADSQFRHWITADGENGFKAEAGRYHLYVSLACPWAHRTLIFRALKKLEKVISVSVVDPYMLEQGWAFTGNFDSDLDDVNGQQFLHQIYTLQQPDYSGRVTVPLLWDKKTQAIVNNESSEIIRMLGSAFDGLTDVKHNYYPEALRSEIDAINDFIYPNINNGVYRCGFATTQAAYEKAFDELFSALDALEQRLKQQHYLVGDQITEADWRLFTTLIRFDAVYYSHFKCNLHQLGDYSNLSHYLRELYQVPGVKSTVNFTHIKQHYYYSQSTVNPTRIVPKGPILDFDQPHNRAQFLKEER